MPHFKEYFCALSVSVVLACFGLYGANASIAGDSSLWMDWFTCFALVPFWPAAVMAAFLNFTGINPDGVHTLILYVVISPWVNLLVYSYSNEERV